MNVRSLLLCALAVLCFGCAAPEKPQTAGATSAAPTQLRSSRVALTGSRLPPLDDDDAGSSTVSAATGDDYRHNDATRVRVLNGDPRGGM